MNYLFVTTALFYMVVICLIYLIVRTLSILRVLLKCPLIQDVFPDLPRESSFPGEHITLST